MYTNATQDSSGNRGRHNRQVSSSADFNHQPIINWALLWSRVWLFLKRIVAELWFMLSRRVPKNGEKISRTASAKPTPQVGWFNQWSWPMFKVAAAVVLFFYVMQRDIQFTVHMKAPLGQLSRSASGTSEAAVMGIAQPVSFGNGEASSKTSNLDPALVEDYIGRFANIAQAEMKKYKVPASVSMAQAILESQAGQAMQAKVDNNHFGKPLGGQRYESAWRNWREHSLLIVNRFDNLLQLKGDYRAWARGLQAAGYSSNPNYANELLEIIDRFHLEQLDDSTI